MAITRLDVHLQDTAIGSVSPNEGVAAIVYGTSVASGTTLSGKPVLFTSRDEFTTWASGTAGDPKVVGNDAHLAAVVARFYEIAGAGSYLWLILVPTATGDIVTPNAASIKKQIMLTTVGDANLRPRLLGFVARDNDTATAGFPSTTQTTAKAIDTLRNDLFEESIRTVCVYASNFDFTTYTGASAPSLGTWMAPSVFVQTTTSVYTTTTDASGNITAYVPVKDVGEVLGIMAMISVSQSIGDCSRPPVTNKAFFNSITNVTDVSTLTKAQYEMLGSKQIGFHRRRNWIGIYFNDGATCNDPTQALSKLNAVRLANAVCDDAEAFFQQVINTQAQANPKTGNIAVTTSTQLENEFYNRYCVPRLSAGQASSIAVQVSAKNNNLVATRTMIVKITIQPAPDVEQVDVYLSFVIKQE